MATALASEAFAGIDHVAFSDLFLEEVRATARSAWAGPANTAYSRCGAGTLRSLPGRW